MTSKYESLGELAEKAEPSCKWFTGDEMATTFCMDDADADFVAAASPSAILSLLADMKVMQEALEFVVDVHEDGEKPYELRCYVPDALDRALSDCRAALQRVKGES